MAREQEFTIAPVRSDDPKSEKKPEDAEKTGKPEDKKDDEKKVSTHEKDAHCDTDVL